MFDWWKRWTGAERRAREEREIAEASERAMAMARFVADRRRREEAARLEAERARARAREADVTRRWEVARREEEERFSQARMLMQQMQAQRESTRPRPHAVPGARKDQHDVPAGSTDSMPFMPPPATSSDSDDRARPAPLTGKGGGFDGGGASGDWSSSRSSSGESSRDSDRSGGDSSDSGSGGGSD